MRALSYAIVTTDIDEIPVLLGCKEWNEHILKRHPELNNFLDEIKQAIEKPHLRHRDPEDSSSHSWTSMPMLNQRKGVETPCSPDSGL
ncbi:TPA: hypothetical protein EYP66_12030 [Candidatus Poribacteria bacterium]|nr:hypothetical protein [Candidatus Poribacteria bacterium]